MTAEIRSIRCVLIGGGGHARVLIDALLASGVDAAELAVVDADPARRGALMDGVLVVGGDGELPQLMQSGTCEFIVGLGGTGDNAPRQALFERATAIGMSPRSVVHPRSIVSTRAVVAAGAQILAGAIVNPGAHIEANAIVNTGAIVEHDCEVGAHAHVATGARLAGGVTVGSGAHIGAGAVVRQSITIGSNAVVGAGAVVVRNVRAAAVVVGVPAKELQR